MNTSQPSEGKSSNASPEIPLGHRGAAFGFIEGVGWGSLPGLIWFVCAALGLWNGKGFRGAAVLLVLGVVVCGAAGAITGLIFPKAVGRLLGCGVGTWIGFTLGGHLSGPPESPHYVIARGMIIGTIFGAIAGFRLGKHRFFTLLTAWKWIRPVELPNGH